METEERMRATELRKHLVLLGWSQRELARRLSINESTVREMARDLHPIPPNLAAWLRDLSAPMLEKPQPTDWKRGAGS